MSEYLKYSQRQGFNIPGKKTCISLYKQKEEEYIPELGLHEGDRHSDEQDRSWYRRCF